MRIPVFAFTAKIRALKSLRSMPWERSGHGMIIVACLKHEELK